MVDRKNKPSLIHIAIVFTLIGCCISVEQVPSLIRVQRNTNEQITQQANIKLEQIGDAIDEQKENKATLEQRQLVQKQTQSVKQNTKENIGKIQAKNQPQTEDQAAQVSPLDSQGSQTTSKNKESSNQIANPPKTTESIPQVQTIQQQKAADNKVEKSLSNEDAVGKTQDDIKTEKLEEDKANLQKQQVDDKELGVIEQSQSKPQSVLPLITSENKQDLLELGGKTTNSDQIGEENQEDAETKITQKQSQENLDQPNYVPPQNTQLQSQQSPQQLPQQQSKDSKQNQTQSNQQEGKIITDQPKITQNGESETEDTQKIEKTQKIENVKTETQINKPQTKHSTSSNKTVSKEEAKSEKENIQQPKEQTQQKQKSPIINDPKKDANIPQKDISTKSQIKQQDLSQGYIESSVGQTLDNGQQKHQTATQNKQEKNLNEGTAKQPDTEGKVQGTSSVKKGEGVKDDSPDLKTLNDDQGTNIRFNETKDKIAEKQEPSLVGDQNKQISDSSKSPQQNPAENKQSQANPSDVNTNNSEYKKAAEINSKLIERVDKLQNKIQQIQSKASNKTTDNPQLQKQSAAQQGTGSRLQMSNLEQRLDSFEDKLQQMEKNLKSEKDQNDKKFKQLQETPSVDPKIMSDRIEKLEKTVGDLQTAHSLVINDMGNYVLKSDFNNLVKSITEINTKVDQLENLLKGTQIQGVIQENQDTQSTNKTTIATNNTQTDPEGKVNQAVNNPPIQTNQVQQTPAKQKINQTLNKTKSQEVKQNPDQTIDSQSGQKTALSSQQQQQKNPTKTETKIQNAQQSKTQKSTDDSQKHPQKSDQQNKNKQTTTDEDNTQQQDNKPEQTKKSKSSKSKNKIITTTAKDSKNLSTEDQEIIDYQNNQIQKKTPKKQKQTDSFLLGFTLNEILFYAVGAIAVLVCLKKIFKGKKASGNKGIGSQTKNYEQGSFNSFEDSKNRTIDRLKSKRYDPQDQVEQASERRMNRESVIDIAAQSDKTIKKEKQIPSLLKNIPDNKTAVQHTTLPEIKTPQNKKLGGIVLDQQKNDIWEEPSQEKKEKILPHIISSPVGQGEGLRSIKPLKKPTNQATLQQFEKATIPVGFEGLTFPTTLQATNEEKVIVNTANPVTLEGAEDEEFEEYSDGSNNAIPFQGDLDNGGIRLSETIQNNSVLSLVNEPIVQHYVVPAVVHHPVSNQATLQVEKNPLQQEKQDEQFEEFQQYESGQSINDHSSSKIQLPVDNVQDEESKYSELQNTQVVLLGQTEQGVQESGNIIPEEKQSVQELVKDEGDKEIKIISGENNQDDPFSHLL